MTTAPGESRSGRILVEDDPEALFALAQAGGWGDGLPLVAPTEARVEAMLAHTRRRPGDELGIVAPAWGVATVEQVAVNAVLAGCRPDYFPVVLAAVEALLDDAFNLYGIQATTNPVAPLVVVNGPVARRIGVNGGSNAFGQGWRANATIGRAVRLVLLNIGGGTPGELDRATQGQPAKYTFCVAENEAESPWVPLSVERGLPPGTSAATVVGVHGFHNIIDLTARSARELLEMLAAAVAAVGTNNVTHGGEPMLALSPEHARQIAADGFSKDDVRRFMYEHARVRMTALPARFVEVMRPRRPKWMNFEGAPLSDRWEDFLIAVVGGPGIHSAFLPTFGSSFAVTRPVEDVEPR